MVKLPRGQKQPTAPAWAREASDLKILESLATYADGLRFQELYKGVESDMSKPTVIAGLRRLEKNKDVERNRALKRYRISSEGRDELRRRLVIRIMTGSHELAYHSITMSAFEGMFANLFLRIKNSQRVKRGKVVECVGFRAAAKKRSLFWHSWLYFIAKYAMTEGLLRPSAQGQVRVYDLIKAWKAIFPQPLEIAIAEYLDSDSLLDWLRREPHADKSLNRAIREYEQLALQTGNETDGETLSRLARETARLERNR
jgi:DNA-binding PadR family transcriptional regulator